MVLSGRIPDLDSLELLLAVARTGSINLAAAQAGLSQQAASARIASVEARTGVVLVTRTSRGSHLTPAGVIVAEWATKLLDVATELDAGLSALRHERQTHLRVSASLTIAEQLLPGWLVALNADADRRGGPVAKVVLVATNSDNVTAQIRDGHADLGFVEGPIAPRGLRWRSVGHDRLIVVTRPDHPWARRHKPVTAVELASTPLVTREAGSGTRDTFDHALRAALGPSAIYTTPALALSTTAAVRAAVLAGAGPAVLSELAVSDDLAAHRLVTITTEELRLNRTLRVIWQGGSLPSAGVARDLVTIAANRGRAAPRA
jgi:molybdate transport repressor ModE-like protein